MEKGFIKLSRSFFDNKIWQTARAFSECEAWLDLIQSARFEASPTTSRIGSYEVTWGRGQYPASIRFLSKKWGRSERWVRSLLGRLKREKMITVDNTKGISVITLVNFDKYNGDTLSDTPSDTLNRLNNKRLSALVTNIVTQQVTQILENEGKMRHTLDTNKKKEEEYITSQFPPISPPIGETPLREIKAYVLSCEQTWLDAIGMNRHLPPENVGEWLDKFFAELEMNGETHKELKDFKKHFNNWLKIQLEHENSGNRKNTGNSKALREKDTFAQKDYSGGF